MQKCTQTLAARLNLALDTLAKDPALPSLQRLRSCPNQLISATILRHGYALASQSTPDSPPWADLPAGWQLWLGDMPDTAIDSETVRQCTRWLHKLDNILHTPHSVTRSQRHRLTAEAQFITQYLHSSRTYSDEDANLNLLKKDYRYLKTSFGRLLTKLHRISPELAEYVKSHLVTGLYFQWRSLPSADEAMD